MAANCQFAEYVCRKCNKKGHLARVCRSQKFASRNGKVSGAGAQANQLTSGHRSSSISDVAAAAEGTFPHSPAPAVQGHPKHVYRTECGRGENLASQGSVGRVEKDLSLFIVWGKGPALFGRDWLASIKLRWPSIAYHSVGGMNLEELLRQFGEVFRPELGTSQTPPVHLSVREHKSSKVFLAKTSALCDQRCTGTRVGASGR